MNDALITLLILSALASAARVHADDSFLDPIIDDGTKNATPECQEFASEIKRRYGSESERQKQFARAVLSKNISWENDVFTYRWNSDTYYTNGIQIKWTNNPCRDRNHLSRTLARLAVVDLFGVPRDEVFFNSGTSFGIYMFTPEDIEEPTRQLDDRPFAGYAFIGKHVSWRVADLEKLDPPATQHVADFQLGVVGPKAGQRWAQNYVHADLTGGGDSFEAWNNQIDDELTFNFNYLYNRYFGGRESGRLTRSAFYHLGFNVGNIANYVNGGVTGVLFSSGPVFPTFGLVPTNAGFLQNSSRDNYIYFGVDLRLYEGNLFIEGRGESSHDEIDLVPVVYDAFVGFKYYLPGGCLLALCANQKRDVSLDYLLFRRSKEFDSTEPERTSGNVVGRIAFSYNF